MCSIKQISFFVLQVEVLDLKELDLPFVDQELEVNNTFPAPVLTLREKIQKADGACFLSPSSFLHVFPFVLTKEACVKVF
jgi:NAD(P)H-dependent FMN reductase